MKTPEKKIVDEYLRCDVFCPWCGGNDVVGESLETDVAVSWQEVSCNHCNAEWQNEYRLQAISWIQNGERIWSDEFFEAEESAE